MAQDSVSTVKELCDSEGLVAPQYEILRVPTSPDHACRFYGIVIIGAEHKFTGDDAGNKKDAKQNAAKKFLTYLSDSGCDFLSHKVVMDPVSKLNELAHGTQSHTVIYTDYTMEGPSHKPRFQIAAVVDGFLCDFGTGPTKKEAKKEAAENAITVMECGTLHTQPIYYNTTTRKSKVGQGKDPVSCLEEYCKPREMNYKMSVFPLTIDDNWGCKVIIDGKVYPMHKASTKDEAKKKAAKSTLLTILDEKINILRNANYEAKCFLNGREDLDSPVDLTEQLVFQVYRICHDTLTENFTSQKVVAAFVMKQSTKDVGTVVSLGTGNRTILSEHVKRDGSKVLDSHAEIVARRGLKRYMYKQVRFHNQIRHPESEQKKQSIFRAGRGGLLFLKHDVSFHLYISRPPCGDASEFQSIRSDGIKSKHLRKQGVLRTKIERGEGTIPTSNIDESRINIHSCSDKICRWNVLGLQGALLSHFLSPIYLSSVIIGSFRKEQSLHFERALCGRLNKASATLRLPPDFYWNKCDIHTTSSSSNNEDVYSSKSSQYSINWCEGDIDVEIVDGTLGSLIGSFIQDDTSRISKKKLYKEFILTFNILRRNYSKKRYYNIDKKNARTYSQAKNSMFDAFQKSGCSTWIKFGRNVDDFSVST